MDIQSIHGATKSKPVLGTPADGEAAPVNGFSALLELVSSQVKASLGFGAMDTSILKNDNSAPVRTPEPRDTKTRPERNDDRDAKAKAAKDVSSNKNSAANGTKNNDQTQATNAGAQTPTGQEQGVVQTVMAAADASVIARTEAVIPLVTTQVAAEAVATVQAQAAGMIAVQAVTTEAAVETLDVVIDPKAATTPAANLTAEKIVVAETTLKDTARVQQALNPYAPAQAMNTADDTVAATETIAADPKTAAKDPTAARMAEARSAAAQEQANNLARLLGTENKVQVQVSVTPAHAGKQMSPDVSVYNIYAGYSAAAAISLANGQFGQSDTGAAATVGSAPKSSEGQAAVAAPAQPLPSPSHTSTGQPTARTESASPAAIQATNAGGGTSNATLGFSAFANNGAGTNAGQTQAAQQANPTDRPAATAQHVIEQIKVNITKAAKAGLDRVTIQLKPVELGRIEIKLEMSEDHKVRVTVTADNKDTLNLLQTDARALERTLNDAGLRTDANNLHFNLRGDGDAAADSQRGNGGGKNDADASTENANDNAEHIYDYGAAASARGGVDTFA